MQCSIPGNFGMIAQHQQGRRNRRWYLGIQSKKDPAHVMTEVYKALMALGCEWMQLSSYRIKCRWKPNITGASGTSKRTGPVAWGKTEDAVDMTIDGDEAKQVQGQNPSYDHTKMRIVSKGDAISFAPIPNLCTQEYCIKIGLTLYKVQQSIYLLDFQKMAGDAFSFMTLCANIITELKTLSAASKQQQAILAQQLAAQQVCFSLVVVSCLCGLPNTVIITFHRPQRCNKADCRIQCLITSSVCWSREVTCFVE